VSRPEAHPLVDAVIDGPSRVGSERRWQVTLRDGRQGAFATLLPELASDEAVRRRYLRDLERRVALDDPGVAPVLDHGEGLEGQTPWRLRLAPEGPTLAALLDRRAPLPVADAAGIVAAIADILHRLHRGGVVLRDLSPKLIVMSEDGPVLTDVGLARVDLLSTRTAASLVLEGSPYASPEQLRRTAVDQRSDLYGLGVIAWQALTGLLPYGEGLALLRDDAAPPSLRAVRGEVPPTLAWLVERCLESDPERRPASAAEVARVLRGGDPHVESERTTCQSCGASLRIGQRLCVSCGRLAITYEHDASDPDRQRLVLTKVRERADQIAALREVLESVSAGPVPPLNFIVGDRRMYSKEERERGLRLPIVLLDDLAPKTATALQTRLQAAGVVARARGPAGPARRKIAVITLAVMLVPLVALLAAGVPTLPLVLAVGLVGAITAAIASKVSDRRSVAPALLRLREGPAALPASDPLVARLAALIEPATPADVRERIGELALAVQNLVDHRMGLREASEREEVDVVTEPISPLVSLVEREVHRLRSIDASLADLDEGALVRGLASAEARGGSASDRESFLEGLDRLRALEDERAGALHRLLEAASLLRRSVDLGLEVRDPQAHHERQVQLALQALGA
jgi:hypothetical protein